MKQSSSNEMAEERKELKFEVDSGQQCPLPKKLKVPVEEVDFVFIQNPKV